MSHRSLYRRLFYTELNQLPPKAVSSNIINPGKDIPLEWWYFTGHLQSKTEKFGYEFCIFKIHPATVHLGPLLFSLIRKRPMLLFHFALTDKTSGKFYTFQDSCLPSSEFSPNKLTLKLHETELKYQHQFLLQTKNNVADLSLTLTPLKRMIKHFRSGFANLYPHQRTYYVSFTRLKTSGTLKIKNKVHKITGLSWFDHQKMNSYTKGSLTGWDWFSLMLSDKSEVMIYMLRDHRGLNNHYLGGSYIFPNGKVLSLSQKDFTIERMGFWKSPHTKIVYPSGWQISIPKLKINVLVTPTLRDQELHQSIPFSYWEGACDVEGKKNGKRIEGQSYVELVGYDKRVRTKFLRLLTGNF